MVDGYFGQEGLSDATGEWNLLRFIVRQELAALRTSHPVKVVAVHGGGVSGKGATVDVQPLINQTDSQGNQTPHGTIYGIPITRNQGGGNAFINDPKVGDIGHMVIGDRDMSVVKSTNAQANPGSFRRHDMADGVYHAAIPLGGDPPTQYMYWTDTGFTIMDQNGNTITGGPSGVTINGLIVDQSGNLTTPGGVQAGTGTGDSVTLQHHNHGGPPPVPGT